MTRQNTRKAERKLCFSSFSLNAFSCSAASLHVSKTGYIHARRCFIPLIQINSRNNVHSYPLFCQVVHSTCYPVCKLEFLRILEVRFVIVYVFIPVPSPLTVGLQVVYQRTVLSKLDHKPQGTWGGKEILRSYLIQFSAAK